MALFISVEGGEGSGKSTLLHALAGRLEAARVPLVVTREPGGTGRGLALREMIFAEEAPLDAWGETFLYLADRAIHVEEVIRPALARGSVVLCDRYVDSTIAYQGYGRRLDVGLLENLNRRATDGLLPHLTFLLDLPVRDGLARAQAERHDRIGRETQDFHQRVAEGFRRIALAEPDRVKVMDAAAPAAEVLAAAWSQLEPRLRRHGYALRV